jgi:Ohr subfamily peroxiredoxin
LIGRDQQRNDEMTDTILYTGRTHVTGGRDGAARSSDGRLDTPLSPPGSAGEGTNPEQLFAAGWSACFIGAMGLAAQAAGVKLPADTAVDAEVDLAKGDSGYFLQARLGVSLPGVDAETARAIVDQAHQTCPYSKATRGNIAVEITLN